MSSGRVAALVLLVRRASWLAALIVPAWLLLSALSPARLPVSLRLLIAVVGLTAAVVPAIALVMVAFLVPLGYVLVTSVWNVYPLALSEALVLAFFVGYAWSARRRFIAVPPPDDPLRWPTLAFAAVVVGATVVHLTILQAWHDYPLPYVVDLIRFLRTDYLSDLPDPRQWIDGRGFLATPALLLESIALMRCVRWLCTEQPSLPRRLAAALLASAVIAAGLGLLAPLEAARASHQSLLHVLLARRWSTPALPSLNTAGPFFMLFGFVGLAAATDRRARWWLWLPGAAIAFNAMWLTQTRSAIVSALVVVVALGVWVYGERVRRISRRALVTTALAAAVAVGTVLVFLNPGHILASGATHSLRFRVLFAEVGLRMVRSAPLTGIGIAQYEVRYFDFASRDVLRLDPRVNNAHNYFLWLTAELGLLGLGTFAWFLWTALVGSWDALAASPRWPRVLTFAGLVAFLITWSIGQPISLPHVAFTFWTVFGITGAPDPEPDRATPPRAIAAARPTRRGPLVAAMVALLVVLLMPGQRARAVADIDMSRVYYGFSERTTDPDGRSYRLAGSTGTFFQRATVPAIDLPVGAKGPGTLRVIFSVDGTPQPPVVVTDGAWQTVRLQPAADAWQRERYWRIDLRVEPLGADARTTAVPDERRLAIGDATRLPAWQARP